MPYPSPSPFLLPNSPKDASPTCSAARARQKRLESGGWLDDATGWRSVQDRRRQRRGAPQQFRRLRVAFRFVARVCSARALHHSRLTRGCQKENKTTGDRPTPLRTHARPWSLRLRMQQPGILSVIQETRGIRWDLRLRHEHQAGPGLCAILAEERVQRKHGGRR